MSQGCASHGRSPRGWAAITGCAIAGRDGRTFSGGADDSLAKLEGTVETESGSAWGFGTGCSCRVFSRCGSADCGFTGGSDQYSGVCSRVRTHASWRAGSARSREASADSGSVVGRFDDVGHVVVLCPSPHLSPQGGRKGSRNVRRTGAVRLWQRLHAGFAKQGGTSSGAVSFVPVCAAGIGTRRGASRREDRAADLAPMRGRPAVSAAARPAAVEGRQAPRRNGTGREAGVRADRRRTDSDSWRHACGLLGRRSHGRGRPAERGCSGPVAEAASQNLRCRLA